MDANLASARDFLKPDGVTNRARAGLLFIESYPELPLLSWPRRLIDTIVQLEQSMLLFRHAHARMVERMIGRRMGNRWFKRCGLSRQDSNLSNLHRFVGSTYSLASSTITG